MSDDKLRSYETRVANGSTLSTNDSATLGHIEEVLQRSLTGGHLEQALSAFTLAQGQGGGTPPTTPAATENAPAPATTNPKIKD